METTKTWSEAKDLKPGDKLKVVGKGAVVVAKVRNYGGVKEMRDLTTSATSVTRWARRAWECCRPGRRRRHDRGRVDLEVVAPAFEVWLRSGFALPPDPVPDTPLTADVYIDKIPVDGVALLMRARKLLGADWRVGDLKELVHRPTVPGSEVGSSVRAAA